MAKSQEPEGFVDALLNAGRLLELFERTQSEMVELIDRFNNLQKRPFQIAKSLDPESRRALLNAQMAFQRQYVQRTQSYVVALRSAIEGFENQLSEFC